MTQLLIRRQGALIDIGPADGTPLPQQLLDAMTQRFSFQLRKLIRGRAQFYDDAGNQRTSGVEVETKRMYVLENGRLVTGFGFLTTLVELVQQHGHTCAYYDLQPPENPQVYEPDWENARRNVKFRKKQEECLYYISQNQCGVVAAAAGFGKTFLFEAVCFLYPRATIAICVRSKSIAARIMDQLSAKFPGVGLVSSDSKKIGERITVYTVGCAHYSPGTEHFLLVDEVHQVMSDKAARAIAEKWQFTRNFGFTATPTGRMDGADAQMEQYFGRQIFRLTYQDAQELGLVVPIRVRWLPMQFSHDPAAGKTGTTRDRWGIWRNEYRNRAIAEDIRLNYPDMNVQILILVATFEHAVMLSVLLPEFALCYGESVPQEKIEGYQRARLLPPNFVPASAARRIELQRKFDSGELKRVIATDVWSTGVDFAALQVLYVPAGRESAIMNTQGPCRTSRISPETGKAYGEVIDCCDFFNPSLHRKALQRRRHFAELGWQQDWPGEQKRGSGN